ncbi:hypothetical protein Lqui_2514 [Legionella quinlivanii]|uniref:Uncharacterized protein n=1 Tax=Legionella quinlivanii TaxID=45073 RepID=A0A0W0XPI1_9GAMM|nr:hypothetical protein [Legionella quinlivanii]KTD46589.1 hypothetical protein Lqui_2514 [Legionella quinlivanii]SEG08578.1 hypothetical protein SAMN02746093_01814 [Legionella quinlivanii DSM 21216]STY10278.1 Uncharacterised protein [Legionella quinlivanii]
MPKSKIKLFLFDRDSSLIDRNNQLFNPDIMIPFLKEVTRYYPWGIVSTGGSEVNFCPGVAAIKAAVGAINTCAYPSLGSGNSSTLRAMLQGDSPAITQIEIQIDYPADLLISEDQKKKLANDLLFQALIQGEIDSKGTINLSIPVPRTDNEYKIQVKVPANSTFELKLGNTRLRMNTLNWLNARNLHGGGDNKLLMAIEAMGQLGLKLKLTDELKRLGIEALETPPDFRELAPNEVLMLDDKKGVYDLMAAAGFQAIRADTPEANFLPESEEEPPVRNTYLNHLTTHLGYESLTEFKASSSIKELNQLLAGYLEERTKDTRQYQSGFAGLFQKSLLQKEKAVQAMKLALVDPEETKDLMEHLNVLRQGELGKGIRAFVKAGKANDIIGYPVHTVTEFIQALSAQAKRLTAGPGNIS